MIFEVEHQRHDVDLIKIDNDETKIVFTNYGARIVSWKYHDNNIVLGNVVEADEFYFADPFNFGATIGRYAGRIASASFELDGRTYQLETNDGANHLHGGENGLNRRIFDYEVIDEIGQIKIIFTTTIKEEEDHYPGDMTIKVTHTYDADHKWTVQYEAESTKKTLFNPSNHVYFNLNRDNNAVDNHSMRSSSLKMYVLDDQHIIKGDQPLDLHQIIDEEKILFKDIFESNHKVLKQQMLHYKGLDHPFEFGDYELLIDNSEFELKINTDMPNFVMFTFNDPQSWESEFNIYKSHSGFSVETQYLPNDINMFGGDAQSILESHTPFISKTSFQINEKSSLK
ncbi:aldose epimerase family protein [Staphylococcus saccharolyticus]|uniref:Aldose 1-epimerase n=1 Tax=Staphylococcus saccharolyticus TaxID=33028 RepID=A0A380H2Z9_9STAP|nr:aldose epimerase family protein [Staphylococcus saccharolyticus]MBL7564832.1 galactose mutarotase [Staphylococcus saccharolyticus]MBL7570904.1 galactose mutarotase [Staphylococcus saccharolyticus]QQB98764.1 galactose mutarotase [Staphylococcus saccharolyticus]QRJ67021.1 galactose mutarotase [Staphylococcus saccharolyticus]RTX99818.1 galactose mutarotase [Staphylococcus saccharolyticus]